MAQLLPRILLVACLLFPAVLCGKTGQKPNANLPNMWCLSWHCSKTMYHCMTDIDCREGLFCLQACGTDSQCTFACIYKYTNDKYAKFLKCAVTENGCVQLKAEKPPYKCRKDPATAVKAAPDNLVGTWKMVSGLNQFHDCQHGCRTMKIKAGSQSNHFEVVDNFLHEDKRAIEVVRTLSPEAEGQYKAVYSIAGLNIKESWKILESDKDRLHISYCGHLGAWEYDGAIVLQRDADSEIKSQPGYCTVNQNVPNHCQTANTSQEL